MVLKINKKWKKRKMRRKTIKYREKEYNLLTIALNLTKVLEIPFSRRRPVWKK